MDERGDRGEEEKEQEQEQEKKEELSIKNQKNSRRRVCAERI